MRGKRFEGKILRNEPKRNGHCDELHVKRTCANLRAQTFLIIQMFIFQTSKLLELRFLNKESHRELHIERAGQWRRTNELNANENVIRFSFERGAFIFWRSVLAA